MQTQRAEIFHQLHQSSEPLVLVNAWDAGSARLIERAGSPAVATTSAGVSWALGRPDGHGLTKSQAVETLKEMARVLAVPLSVDIEGGYGTGSSADVAATVADVISLGAVGINLEDSPGVGGEPLLPPEVQAHRIRAARSAADDAGLKLFINARTDVYLRSVGEPAGRPDAVRRRANAYLEAGADGIFVPGLGKPRTIEALARDIEAPLNIMVGPGSPAVDRLAELGVSRVSLGPSAILAVYDLLWTLTRNALGSGSCDAGSFDLPSAIGSAELGDVNQLFTTST